MGWQGQGEDGPPLLVSLGMSPTGEEDSGGRKKPFLPAGCSHFVLDNPEGDIRISSPCGTEHWNVALSEWTNSRNRGHEVLGKTEFRRNTSPDGNRLSPQWENCPLGKRTRHGVGQVGKQGAWVSPESPHGGEIKVLFLIFFFNSSLMWLFSPVFRRVG